jgi:hypothetical protein
MSGLDKAIKQSVELYYNISLQAFLSNLLKFWSRVSIPAASIQAVSVIPTVLTGEPSVNSQHPSSLT